MMKSADMNRGLKMIKKLFLGTLLILFVNLLVSWVFMTAAKGGGIILQQELDASGNGYTVMKVWGTYYEMGYSHGYLLGDQIDEMVTSIKEYIGSSYNDVKSEISNTYFPPDMRDEIDGMVAGIQEVVQASTITPEDIIMLNTIGDWDYSPNCRAHSCWGSYVNPPVKTLSTRRLDYTSFLEYFDSLNVLLCAYEPSDTSKVRWVNLFFPGWIIAHTSVNEFGTLVSIHDSPASGGSHGVGANVITRSAAMRYMMTIDNLPVSISQQTDFVYDALQNYVPWTGSFLNYYAPMGNAGVISCSASQGFYNLRKPRQSYFGGEVIVTSNQYTDGYSAPSDATFFNSYYSGSTPKSLADHWGLLDGVDSSNGAFQLSVEYRDRADMTIWARGRLIGTATTPIIKLEWSELFEDIVISNYPPVLAPIGAKTVTEEGLLEFIITASDPDSGDILTYSADNLPLGAIFDSETQLFSWTPVYGDAGNYTVTFTVTDNGTPTRSDSEEVTI
ncbi:MAG: putative Ig domain-containing protein, partial [Deltaproteobacteria bacterium]|nr:putative Ig domain-containing protein [Deltaproteobacteria bacterium]